MAGTLCNFATQLKFVFGYDDTLDVRIDFPHTPYICFVHITELFYPLGVCVSCCRWSRWKLAYRSFRTSKRSRRRWNHY